jgi:hypothetical protein
MAQTDALRHPEQGQVHLAASKDLFIPLSHGANLHVFVENSVFLGFLEGPKMHLSPYGIRNRKFFTKWPDLLFTPRAFLSNNCIKQMY